MWIINKLLNNQIIIGVFIGVITSFLSLLLQGWYRDKKNEKIELKKYSICLESTKNELSFYLDKLIQLLDNISQVIKAIQNKSTIIIPSYTFYPNFLEKCKIEINSFFRNSHLVKDVGHCHFELCHIVERLNYSKDELSRFSELTEAYREINAKYAIHDLEGFKLLIDQNIQTFKSVISYIDRELNRVKEKIRCALC